MEKRKLPNATAVLVLGIFSIITCCCYGFGIVLGIIALVLASKDNKLYNAEPEVYSNYANLNIGRILSIIGITLSAIFLAIVIFFAATMTEEEMLDFQENLRLKMEQQES